MLAQLTVSAQVEREMGSGGFFYYLLRSGYLRQCVGC